MQLDERKKRGNIPRSDLVRIGFDCAIVYLEPDEIKLKSIIASNISSVRELRRCLDNMELIPATPQPHIHVYCEDEASSAFARFLLERNQVDYREYFDFRDMNLGWANYVQLLRKKAFNVNDSLIILDADVKGMPEYRSHSDFIDSCDNVVFLPVEVEKGLFELLKQQVVYSDFYNMFQDELERLKFGYHTCFNKWMHSSSSYDIKDFKNWFSYVCEHVNRNSFFEFWHSKNPVKSFEFVKELSEAYNFLAEKMKIDPMPSPSNCNS